jgi:uncharacterized repeat protein (TIGR01451 family)
MKQLILILFLFFIRIGIGQSITVNNTSVVDLINNQFSGFTGNGVSVFNVKVNGSIIDSSFTIGNIGGFTNSNNLFPLNSGFLMTTGNSNGAVGPNNATSFTNNTPATSNVGSDANLSVIANGTVTNGVVLEFDFIAVGDSISFNYIFGSEEYPEFSPSTFNDVFGFFLWGPTINGPYVLNGYPNGGVNIATLLDGTPVSINNVGDANNSQYYVFNESSSSLTYGDAIQYDGTTMVMTAGYNVICGEVYHIKMAISNVGDQSYDSGVFLKANSLNSQSTAACGKNYGLAFYDYNENCSRDFLDFGVENVTITINPGNYVSTTNPGGFWVVDSLPYGNYTITIDTTNLYWNLTCPVTQSFTIDANNQSIPDFGLVDFNPCTDPDVSIYAPFLRPCLPNQMIYVSACNQPTATGILNNSYVDVELDPLMSITSFSLPYIPQGNNVYRFQTGDLYPGQCVNFNIATTISSQTVSCAGLLGLTLCIDANLYPLQSCALDTIPSDPIINDGTGGTLNGFPQACTLPWDQSSLSVDGWCQGDSVYFSITNTGQPGGGDMECYSPMWVTVDGVVTYTDSIMIPGGQTVVLSYFGNGQTWILNAEQHPLHPGNSHPNAHIEACGDTSNWTPDIVNDFPQDDADPVVDIYCGVVTGSYDPNDKTGYPIGQTDQKYIQPNQQLQYVIRFQNTGTDTAFTVVIRDTLDTDLNIFTVTSGVSSHQYDFRMYGPRVLEWTFNNINLPDSSTNQVGSNGFVTFHVDQVPNLTPGTEITNDADIYFDFNDPITTNTTMHRIYEGFVSVLNVEELTQNGKSLLVYPNPTSNSITIKGEKNMNQSFHIFDQMGREVFKGKLDGTETEVNLSILSKGIYTLKIDGNFKPANIIKE